MSQRNRRQFCCNNLHCWIPPNPIQRNTGSLVINKRTIGADGTFTISIIEQSTSNTQTFSIITNGASLTTDGFDSVFIPHLLVYYN